MVDEIVVGFEDAVGEPVVAHELPDVLDRVELWALRRQQNDGDIGRHEEAGGQVPGRMALVNADREIVRKIMTEPGPRWEPQSPPRAENAANFFRWAANAPFEQGAVGDLR